MLEQPTHFPAFLEWEAFTDQGIELSPDHITQAVQISQSIGYPRRRWQTYLQALAWLGLKQWLARSAPDLAVNDAHCSILQPQYASLLEPVCHLQVGAFTLCLIATGSLTEPIVHLPKAVIELPPLMPHFYVLLQVLEELMEVQIYGYLRRDRLLEQQQSAILQPTSHWTVATPVQWFNSDPSALLLELRCLEPSAISFPVAVPPSLLSVAQLQAKLVDLLPQLRSPKCLPEQVLTWEEGATLLTQPELVDWLYQAQQSDAQTTIDPEPAPVPARLPSELITQPAINVGLWLQDQLDVLAQQVSWGLLPLQTALTPALRSRVEEVEMISAELEQQQVVIPPEGRGAYRDLGWQGQWLRLYAFTWILPASDALPEWTLLLVLGTQSGGPLPTGVRFQVGDATQTLAEQVTTEAHQEAYLCVQVAGNWNEHFWGTIELNGTVLSLSPFAFHPDELL